MDESVSGEPTGVARWLTIHDDLLRGLTHALSNRVGTVSATAYLIELQPIVLPATAAALREEGERLETMIQLLRLLPRREHAAAEPIIPADVVKQALALQAYHPTLGDIPVDVVLDGDVQPAYVDPTSAVMALTLAIGASQRAAHAGGRAVLTIRSDTDVVSIVAAGRRPDGSEGLADDDAHADARAVSWLLHTFGGVGVVSGAGVTVTMPTLQAARRTQRR